MSYFNAFFFGIYPYIALSIFLLGSLVRFEREQYSWKSDSSQVLYRGHLRTANILFHVGILGLFFGHLVGLLTPVLAGAMMAIRACFCLPSLPRRRFSLCFLGVLVA